MLEGWKDLNPFKAWCIQILPTIFDESMSYYEVLCKVIKILNNTMEDVNLLKGELESFKISVDEQFQELREGTWIDGTIPYLEKLLEKYIKVGIFFEINESGYFVANIPDSWDEITFNTSGYDYPSLQGAEFGNLILSY